jgi:hypothetical protein
MSKARRTTDWWRDSSAVAAKLLTDLLNDVQLSAPQLAEKARVDARTVYRLISGSVKSPHSDTLKRLFEALGTDTQRFKAAMGVGATENTEHSVSEQPHPQSTGAEIGLEAPAQVPLLPTSSRAQSRPDATRAALDAYDAAHGTALVQSITNAILSLPDGLSPFTDDPQRLEDSFARHALEVAAWSERTEFFGLAGRKDTPATTVHLYASLPRKFGNDPSTQRMIAEQLLLNDAERHALLGDLGAGKTTTLKRVARYLLRYPSDIPLFPIVIRLRELSRARLLEEVLSDIFGVPHARVPVALDGREPRLPGASMSSFPTIQLDSVESPFVIHSAGEPAEWVLARVLQTAQVILLLDGLDETPAEIRTHTESAITRIIRASPQARMTITCRPSDYVAPFEGVSTLQLCPLDPGQIATIVRHWCSNPKDFMHRLGKVPYADLASRPLFLCQLIQLYEVDRHLPMNPPAIYRRIVRLALDEWDRQKRLDRPSRYAQFGTDEKFIFLSHLAFRLTFVLREKQFDTDALIEVYRSICGSFFLPPSEALLVAAELETHTGLFQEAGGGRYEFAFLSIQEYLAAERLLQFGVADSIGDYLVASPSSVGVAVAISDKQHGYLYAIINHRSVKRAAQAIRWSTFFDRIAFDAPEFITKHILAQAIGHMVWSTATIDGYVKRLLAVPEVQSAMRRFLALYDATVYDPLKSPRYDLVSTEAGVPQRLLLYGSWVGELFPSLAFRSTTIGRRR